MSDGGLNDAREFSDMQWNLNADFYSLISMSPVALNIESVHEILFLIEKSDIFLSFIPPPLFRPDASKYMKFISCDFNFLQSHEMQVEAFELFASSTIFYEARHVI